MATHMNAIPPEKLDKVLQRWEFLQYELSQRVNQANYAQLSKEFSDLGAGGVKLGETAVRENSAEQARANEISNCHVHDGGKMFHSAIGVWIGQSAVSDPIASPLLKSINRAP